VTVTATETIRKELFVDAAPETAFRVFTEQISDWWPLAKYSVYLDDAESVGFEDRDGWRLIERAKDGRENVWGEVLAYELASRVRFTWHPGRDSGDEPTEVEVTFTADKDGTVVVLEHSGWETLSAERSEGRVGYDNGWPAVLEQFRQVAEA
jgi:uncharacterized protein YndB with AHSA1/START domain